MRRVVLRLLQAVGGDAPDFARAHTRREAAREHLAVDQPVRLRHAADQRRRKQRMGGFRHARHPVARRADAVAVAGQPLFPASAARMDLPCWSSSGAASTEVARCAVELQRGTHRLSRALDRGVHRHDEPEVACLRVIDHRVDAVDGCKGHVIAREPCHPIASGRARKRRSAPRPAPRSSGCARAVPEARVGAQATPLRAPRSGRSRTSRARRGESREGDRPPCAGYTPARAAGDRLDFGDWPSAK